MASATRTSAGGSGLGGSPLQDALKDFPSLPRSSRSLSLRADRSAPAEDRPCLFSSPLGRLARPQERRLGRIRPSDGIPVALYAGPHACIKASSEFDGPRFGPWGVRARLSRRDESTPTRREHDW